MYVSHLPWRDCTDRPTCTTQFSFYIATIICDPASRFRAWAHISSGSEKTTLYYCLNLQVFRQISCSQLFAHKAYIYLIPSLEAHGHIHLPWLEYQISNWSLGGSCSSRKGASHSGNGHAEWLQAFGKNQNVHFYPCWEDLSIDLPARRSLSRYAHNIIA